jgi:hypothetical protein
MKLDTLGDTLGLHSRPLVLAKGIRKVDNVLRLLDQPACKNTSSYSFTRSCWADIVLEPGKSSG